MELICCHIQFLSTSYILAIQKPKALINIQRNISKKRRFRQQFPYLREIINQRKLIIYIIDICWY